MTRPVTRTYEAHGLAGCVERRKSTATGFLVSVYNCAQAGMESDPETPWATVCEEHNTICVHSSLMLARLHVSDPEGWCEACRKGYVRNYVVSRYVRITESGERHLVANKDDATLFETDADMVALLVRKTPGKMMENVKEIAGYPVHQFQFVRLTGDEIERLIQVQHRVG